MSLPCPHFATAMEDLPPYLDVCPTCVEMGAEWVIHTSSPGVSYHGMGTTPIPESRHVNFRIGVHVGDVMVRAGDLFGDGVNIAARLPSARVGRKLSAFKDREHCSSVARSL